jgi:hypothetical protein
MKKLFKFLTQKEFVLFGVVVSLLAIMDGFNFARPHNNGWWSLNYDGSNDVWHWTKRGVLITVAITALSDRYRHLWDWLIRLIIMGIIALAGQLFIYNYLFKEVF